MRFHRRCRTGGCRGGSVRKLDAAKRYAGVVDHLVAGVCGRHPAGVVVRHQAGLRPVLVDVENRLADLLDECGVEALAGDKCVVRERIGLPYNLDLLRLNEPFSIMAARLRL